MYGNYKEDICSREDKIDYAFLSLISHKINIGIIGAGRAGIIKAKHFLKLNCRVSVISKDNYDKNKDIKALEKYDKFHIECCEYTRDFILDKHLIIIAVDNLESRYIIKKHCEELYKIYIDCMNFKEGMAQVPVQRETESLNIGVSTKGGNPKGAVFIAEKIKEDINTYDGYIEYTTELRNKFKLKREVKDDALRFIFSDDFYFFYENGKAKKIIDLFYGEV